MSGNTEGKGAQRITVRDANQGFSRLIAEVDEHGARFIVTKNNREVARIDPIVDHERAAKEARRRAAWDRIRAVMHEHRKTGDGWTYGRERDALHARSDD